MKIVFDNIAFSNQISGGISVVWQELESRFLKQQDNDIMVLEYKNGERNILHKKIDLSSTRMCLQELFLFLSGLGIYYSLSQCSYYYANFLII